MAPNAPAPLPPPPFMDPRARRARVEADAGALSRVVTSHFARLAAFTPPPLAPLLGFELEDPPLGA